MNPSANRCLGLYLYASCERWSPNSSDLSAWYFQALSHGVKSSTGLPRCDFLDGFFATNELTCLNIPYEKNEIKSAVPNTLTVIVVPDLNGVNSALLPPPSSD